MKGASILIAILFSVLFFSGPLTGQTRYHARSYTTENGLPSNRIKGLQWDEKTQFLWIATDAGIARFNGLTFKTFPRLFEKEGISPRMKMMTRNGRGEIVGANKVNKLFSVRSNKLILEEEYSDTGLLDQELFLLATSRKIIDNYHGNDRILRIAENHPRIVAYGEKESVILAGDSLFLLGPDRFRTIPNKSKSTGWEKILKIGNGIFIFTSEGKFLRIDPEKNRITPTPADIFTGENNSTLIDGNDLFWENGMESPIWIYNNEAIKLIEKNGSISATVIANNIPENTFILFIQYSESLKKLFIGTNSQGLIILDKQFITPVRKTKTGINESTAYYGQFELPGDLILTNHKNLLSLSGDKHTIPDRVPNSRFSFFPQNDSVVWHVESEEAADSHILSRFNTRNLKSTYFPKIKLTDNSAVLDHYGTIYLATPEGIAILENDTARYRIGTDDAENNIYSMESLSRGHILLTTCKYLLDFDIEKNRFDTLFAAGEYCIRTAKKSDAGILIGTFGAGLYMINNGKANPLPLDKNNYLKFTHCFMQDSFGFVWMSTNRGLFRTRTQDLVNFAATGSPVWYQFFGTKDGLDMTELNGGCYPCAIRLKNGKFSFPSMDGLSTFNPAEAPDDFTAETIYLDEVLVNNKAVPADNQDNFAFPTSSKDIAFQLGFPAWCNRENLYIEYRLTENSDWNPLHADNEGIINLSNLPSGSHVLGVRIKNGFGPDDYSYNSFEFSIETPWYREYWAYVLWALALYLVIAGFIRLRTRNQELLRSKLESQVTEKTKELKEKNEALEKSDTIKTRLISIISHDIVTPLRFVTVAGKKLLEKKSQMPEELQKETIAEITETSRELQLLSTNILNWIKYQNENRRPEKERFRPYEIASHAIGLLNSIAISKNIRLSTTMAQSDIIFQYQEPLRILIYNLVLNAINFSDHGTITISGSLTGNEYNIYVSDEGVGMTEEQINNILAEEFIISSANVDNKKGNGLGYLIIKDLLKIIGGELHISSKLNQGTRVRISIPVYK